ncbi:galactoside alpha-(1,2)-fucosyltransferase 2-like [Anthonomus grandis grandis]|uniref:galactoside alpha-(1,2)-fucosyltransferase 2-like n=1 Tax=Anthonomus grandis grandis TaxID=2921223 RepID=UPI0021650B40|nr:galactoside alpha-(1,2)-fucosyltransferase 2-like [Anthonomus grandis grandis]
MGIKQSFLKLFFLLIFLLGVIIIIVLYYVSSKVEKPYKIKKEKVGFLYTFEDLDRQLCEGKSKFNLEQKMNIRSDDIDCPKRGIVSFCPGGRTGNQIWEYASVWAVSRVTGLDAYIPSCIKTTLNEIFENLTLPSFKEIAHCPIQFNKFVKWSWNWSSQNQSIILPRWVVLSEMVPPFIDDIVEEFHFTKAIRDKAQQTILTFVNKLPRKNYTFIGVHVRRTDYKYFLKKRFNLSLVGPKFFYNAMDYYKRKYPNCLFVFVSDDPTWCYKEFGKLPDVFIASYHSKHAPAVDMAIMSACNHSIFDYGTFGEWGALLAGGEVVFNNVTQNVMRKFEKTMKNWHLMSR